MSRRLLVVSDEDRESVAATIEYGDRIALFDQQSTGFVHNDLSRWDKKERKGEKER
jgi:hypothetical protein